MNTSKTMAPLRRGGSTRTLRIVLLAITLITVVRFAFFTNPVPHDNAVKEDTLLLPQDVHLDSSGDVTSNDVVTKEQVEKEFAISQQLRHDAQRNLSEEHDVVEADSEGDTVLETHASEQDSTESQTNLELPPERDYIKPFDDTLEFELNTSIMVNRGPDELLAYRQRVHELRMNMSDPLSSTLNGTVEILPLNPSIPYLGVLIDAGRHYFPIPWLMNLIDTLHRLRFNLIQFRLTDDQAFNIRLDSHPELAQPSAATGNGTVYTPSELRDLVAYANSRKIMIMPEINIPGHAAAWSGIPGLVLPCAHFICVKGYGLPLNVSNPKLMGILKDVIQEVREIFDTSPFLHLGGDELHMSQPCFDELDLEFFDYNSFEKELQGVLVELGIPLDKVIRWEMTGSQGATDENPVFRAGAITHYWASQNYDIGPNDTAFPYFVSNSLYFDTNQEEHGFSIYEKVRGLASHQFSPMAIIVGTFELGPETWLDRNVIGRLLAVAMGSFAEIEVTPETFLSTYSSYCQSLGFDNDLCSLYGRSVVLEHMYRRNWNMHWKAWRESLCERLTETERYRIVQQLDGMNALAFKESSVRFWESFGDVHKEITIDAKALSGAFELKLDDDLARIRQHGVDHSGITLDLVRESPDKNAVTEIKGIIDIMAHLGFNLLQLVIMNDYGFIFKARGLEALVCSVEQDSTFHYDEEMLVDIVNYANQRGIKVMPEISIATRGGGWFNAGTVVHCPDLICRRNMGISLDTSDLTILPSVAAVLHDLRRIFSSQFIHLGYDEREESMVCYNEADIDPDFASFERKLLAVLDLEDIPREDVIRYENSEIKEYPDRAGEITHYRFSHGATTRSNGSQHFTSTDLLFDVPDDSERDAWSIYERTRKVMKSSPTGVIARVGVISTDAWKQLNIQGRLLAMAMGLSAPKYERIVKFRKVYKSACGHLISDNATDVCDLFGKSNPDNDWKKDHMKASNRRVLNACRLRTVELSNIVVKQSMVE